MSLLQVQDLVVEFPTRRGTLRALDNISFDIAPGEILGVGVPPTSPSLGTLIRVGNDYLFSGEWWITIFPGLMLILIALSVNLLGDWLRDALNPRLQ